MNAHFYLLRNSKTGKYYDGRHRGFNKTIGTSEARFASAKNALKEIKKLRRLGNEVDDVEIVPCSVELAGMPIKPELTKLQKGYVIRIHQPDRLYAHTVFWKGNRKTPDVSYSGLFRNTQSPHTASHFKTLEEANDVYGKLKAGLEELIKREKDAIFQSRVQYPNSPRYHKNDTYLRAYQQAQISVIEVG